MRAASTSGGLIKKGESKLTLTLCYPLYFIVEVSMVTSIIFSTSEELINFTDFTIGAQSFSSGPEHFKHDS